MEGPKAAGKKGKLERRCMSEYSHTLHDEGRGFNVWASCYRTSHYLTPAKQNLLNKNKQ
jgi:hypothetical protein